MGSELLALLEREAAAERERVLAEARAQAEEISTAAEAEARRSVAAQRQQQDEILRRNRARAQSTANLRAQALLLETKDQQLGEVFRRAEEALAQVVRDRTRYARILERLIAEGAGGFAGRVVVEAHPDDLDLVRAAAQRRTLDTEVRAAADVWGGVRLLSPDGRYVVLNTLASRLERARPTLAAAIARTLWG